MYKRQGQLYSEMEKAGQTAHGPGAGRGVDGGGSQYLLLCGCLLYTSGFFKRASQQIDDLKLRYSKVETNVEKIEGMLENHQVQLLKDVDVYKRQTHV